MVNNLQPITKPEDERDAGGNVVLHDFIFTHTQEKFHHRAQAVTVRNDQHLAISLEFRDQPFIPPLGHPLQGIC